MLHLRTIGTFTLLGFALLALLGCGGGGSMGSSDFTGGGTGGSGGGSGVGNVGLPVTVTSLTSLVGTYTLVDFTVVGNACGGTVTPNSGLVQSWSGTMTITASGLWTQTITINGRSGSASQFVDVVAPNILETTGLGCTYTGGFQYSSTGVLTTNVPQGTCGFTCSETDVWQKVSGALKPTVATDSEDPAVPSISVGVGVGEVAAR
jgi:hypothetical protein